MSQDVTDAEERARLAAADLAAAANEVIRARTLRWNEARDEVGAALLSRRWTGYAPSGMRKLDEARDDLEFASRALTEIGRISASVHEPAAERGEGADAFDAAGDDAAATGRLVTLAVACERRAIRLRS
ncbi:MAG: hypothetical protein ACP5VP_03675 [Candidatus Limnocylindrales bacterium]